MEQLRLLIVAMMGKKQVEVEQLRLLIVAMVGKKQVGVTEFIFYISVLICIDNMHQCCCWLRGGKVTGQRETRCIEMGMKEGRQLERRRWEWVGET